MAINPETTIRKVFTLPRDLWRRAEDYRFKNRIGTESEAIRRLLIKGLASRELMEEYSLLILMLSNAVGSDSKEEQTRWWQLITQSAEKYRDNMRRVASEILGGDPASITPGFLQEADEEVNARYKDAFGEPPAPSRDP